jgi:hypothetical protein
MSDNRSTISRSTTYSSNPFDCLDDDFACASNFPSNEATSAKSSINIRNFKPQILPKPSTASPINFSDETSKKPPVVSMPTIIKPTTSSNVIRKPLVSHFPISLNEKPSSDDSFEDDPPSPPMPTCPPPVLVIPNDEIDDEDEDKESHAISLYDFESDVVEDLNFKVTIKLFYLRN